MTVPYQTVDGELDGEFEAEFEWEDEFEAEGEFELEDEDEDEFEDELEDFAYELEDEFEDEGEFELEFEDFADPALRAGRLAAEAELMAHLASQAAAARTEAEAEAFLGALIPMAARLLPKAAPLVRKVAPTLIKGVARVGGRLWNNPQTRRLIKAVPSAVVNTVGDLAGQYGASGNVTADAAMRTLGRNFRQSLGRTPAGPQRGRGRRGQRRGRKQAVQATTTLNRRYHQRQAGRGRRARSRARRHGR